MQTLPINKVLPDIKNILNTHNRVVLQAPPGAGKTTAVPIALLDQPWLQNKQIIILEPRRLAARNAAARMAFLLNEKVGQSIGYQIRQDNCFSKQTKILVVTEGILTRKLQADPELKNIALVIFDEFHERNLHADLSLALCLQSQQIIREDLKILVMSATLNTTAISTLLADAAKQNAPIIQSEGRSFPVEINYLDKNIKQTDFRQLISSLLNAIKNVILNHDGNCLVFLPGVKEINQLKKQIDQYLKSELIENVSIVPLHGSLSKQQQDKAISATENHLRKIVLATNIAETSLTIEGINCVIDSGLERTLQYNPSSAMNRLITQTISQDSTEQRAGRAGRLSAGTCYRMWTASQQQRLLKHSIAEISHSDLSTLVLELANWGVLHVNELQWLDTPPSSSVEQAKALLKQLNAIDTKGSITPHGRNILKLGTHPRLAHMMLKAIKLEQTYLACLLASILTEKDLFLAHAEKSYDIQNRLNILRTKQTNNNQQGIDVQQCKKITQTADDFLKRLKQSAKDLSLNKHFNDELAGVLLAFSYPDRIAKQRNHNKPDYLLSSGKGASIPPFLQHSLYEYLVVANLDAKKNNEAKIYFAAEITLQQLHNYFSNNMQHTETVLWNKTQERVEAKQTTNIGKIVLQEKLVTPKDKNIVLCCLIDEIKKIGLQCLNWSTQAVNLKQRVQFIQLNIKNYSALEEQFGEKQFENENLPNFSDEMLLDTLHDWLQPYLKNENSIKQIQKLDLHILLLNQLSWKQQQTVEKLAPEKINVPSGSAIKIDYSDPLKPVLAVRLQEVFGLYETPKILSGYCSLMMHLLSPARKPMQVTQDLNSFWQTTYHEVKKELRGKYKRHYWPDDPFTAQATSKTKKQMNR